jgi:3-methyladenine DNA glycosylase AlkC
VAGTPAYKLFKQAGTRLTFQNSDLVLSNLNKEYKIYERKIITTNLKTLTKREASALFKLANIYPKMF